MKPFELEMTDQELQQLLATWTVSVPTEELRARIFVNHWQPSFLAVPPENHAPWYKSMFNLCSRNRSFGAALAFQICAVAFCFVAIAPPVIRSVVKQAEVLYVAPYRSKMRTATTRASGGGGGQHAPTPVTYGEAPKFATKTFVPPAMSIPHPKLPVVPTITAQAPQIEANNYGDPLSNLTGLSPGQGVHGFGDGKNGGVGSGDGGGYHGVGGDGVYSLGGDVLAPVLVAKVEPEFSEEARRAKRSGSVLLSVVIDEKGIPRDLHVIRPLGLGLDEKAIEAVQRWRFRPGLKNGRPVPVQAQVEVSFRLL